MASIRLVLRKKKNKEGLFPIAIRITKNRKSSFIFSGQYIDIKYWDSKNTCVKKSHPNSKRLNSFLIKKLSEANDSFLQLESKEEFVSAKKVTEKIKSKNENVNFFEVANSYLDSLESNKKFAQLSADKPRVKRLKEFFGSKTIYFEEINAKSLNNFSLYLKKTRNISQRTIINHLVVVRSIFNKAIRENGIDRKLYPFGKGKIIIKFPPTQKRGLEISDIKSLENLDLSHDENLLNARNIWLFSFYFAGIRISDVLQIRWVDFEEDRLLYQMNKNAKPLSFKCPEKAKQLIKYYYKKNQESEFVFPYLNNKELDTPKSLYLATTQATKAINNSLKKIANQLELNLPLTTHIARHTFGRISGDKIPIQVLQKLYRHTDIKTTINYQRSFIHKETDEALDKVLDF